MVDNSATFIRLQRVNARSSCCSRRLRAVHISYLMFDAAAAAVAATARHRSRHTAAAVWRVERMDRVSRRRDGKGERWGHGGRTGRRTAFDRYATDERYPRRAATTSCGSGCEMDFELRWDFRRPPAPVASFSFHGDGGTRDLVRWSSLPPETTLAARPPAGLSCASIQYI